MFLYFFKSLLDKFESVLNQSVCTFNGRVCDENKTFKDFECDEIDNVLKNAVKVEFYREVCFMLNIYTCLAYLKMYNKSL